MIEDTDKIKNEAEKDRVQVNLIINNRAGGNAPMIAQKITGRLHWESSRGFFELNYSFDKYFLRVFLYHPLVALSAVPLSASTAFSLDMVRSFS